MTSHSKKVYREIFQAGGTIFDQSGLPIGFEGSRWKLNSVSGTSMILNWGLCGPVTVSIAEAMIAFMRFNVSTKSTSHASNAFREIVAISHRLGDADAESLREALMQELTAQRAKGSEYRFHYLRDWYRWCNEQQFQDFSDDELLYELQNLRIPGNRKGDAVLSEDPEEGPLDEVEEVALRAALHRDTGALVERALTWSFLALGCNPKNLVHLCESDFEVVRHDGNAFYSLRVPRIKKRQDPRADFKVRKLDPFLARLFEELIKENQTLSIPPGCSRPLFARCTPRQDLKGTPMESHSFHFTSADLGQMLERHGDRLGVVSHRTGERLRLKPRRLRYTFATRKVQEGCSMEALAELLDHTDLQNVIVYYSGQGLSKRLDEALAVSIGPLVNRFMGRVVADEKDAFDGGGRVKAQPMGRIANIGTCGSTTLCTLYPPASCYVCPKFQPWRNAPHRDVLSDLVKQRDARVAAAGREDDRIAKQFDEMILAVGQVVALCEGP